MASSGDEVLNLVQLLVNDQFIATLPCAPQELFARGVDYVQKHKISDEVVCCDVEGNEYDLAA